MKILILGGTGRTGQYLVKEALKQGHSVNALVRDGEKLRDRIGGGHQNLIVIEGTPLDKEKLEEALTGCEAVASALNISRKSDWPWAKVRTPEHLMSDTVQSLIELAPKHHCKRVVVCSAWGANDSKKEVPFWFRWLIDYSNVGAAYRDHERQEDLLKNSALEWTAVRPVGLVNSDEVKPVKVSFNKKPKPSFTITRASVGHFMIDELEKKEYVQKRPVISNK